MKLYNFWLLLITSVLASAVAHAESLEECGALMPEIPGFKLVVKAENNVCYGELISLVGLSPAILVEENGFIIRPILFESALKESGRFNEKGNYIYSYSVDGAIEQVSEAGGGGF